MEICCRVTLLTALLSPVLAVAEQEQDSLLSPALQSTAVRSACADLRSLTGYQLPSIRLLWCQPLKVFRNTVE